MPRICARRFPIDSGPFSLPASIRTLFVKSQPLFAPRTKSACSRSSQVRSKSFREETLPEENELLARPFFAGARHHPVLQYVHKMGLHVMKCQTHAEMRVRVHHNGGSLAEEIVGGNFHVNPRALWPRSQRGNLTTGQA